MRNSKKINTVFIYFVSIFSLFNFLEIHQTFQQDLIRLRLSAARALVQNLDDQSGVGNEKEQIKLSAQVKQRKRENTWRG